MIAIKARFDGKQVVLPSLPPVPECPVIVVFQNTDAPDHERGAWLKLEESALSKVWLNAEDAAYDQL